MEEYQEQCLNCGTALKEEFEFCPRCGQKAKDDLTIGVLFYNTISNYFSIDARFFKSIIPLLLKPGYIAKEFVMGKRLQYLHPAQYYLFASVIFFFLFSFEARKYNQQVDKVLTGDTKTQQIISGADSIAMSTIDKVEIQKIRDSLQGKGVITGISDEDLESLDSVLNSAQKQDFDLAKVTFGFDKKQLDSLIAADASEADQLKAMGLKESDGFMKRQFYKQWLKIIKNSGVGILQVFIDSIPIALFFLLPIFALLLKVFYWRRGRFAHHLVFSFYYFSFLFIVLSILLLVNYILEIPDWIDFLILLSTYFYFWFAMRRFYEQGYSKTLIKSWIVGFVYLSFVVPLAFVIIVVSSFFMY